jgi:hypothetical protein
MIVEGVNFVESACVPMGKQGFVKEFEEVFWLDRPIEERRKILADTYDLMCPPKQGKKKPASKVDKK